MKPASYSESGVDIERGDRFAAHIAGLASKAVAQGIGSFAGGIPLEPGRWKQPRLLATTDGVGTKLLVARRLGDYSTVGIDLVAMCVNDLAVCGATPLAFLDYIACGAIDTDVLEPVMEGIVRGCELAGCTLTGGETAEMPDMYGTGDIDLAGFAVGLVEEDELLPQMYRIAKGDVLLGLPSSGIHSNGLSLARKVVPDHDDQWRALLTPTRIYTSELLKVRTMISAAAHITGGGIEGNLKRVIPGELAARLRWDWPLPPVFETIRTHGGIDLQEMRRVFNMGLGVIMVVPPARVSAVVDALDGVPLHVGELVEREGHRG
jgi:phosphoribosylformylglycinamidine cyclo-ligase